MTTKLAVERGPAVPDKMPALGYYDEASGAESVVHVLDLTDAAAELTAVISAGVSAVQIDTDSDVCIATGPAPVADTGRTPHRAGSSHIVKVNGGAHRVSAVLLSGSGTGTVHVTELH